MSHSFSAMNVAIYVAFTFLFALWTISILCRRYRNYPSGGNGLLPLGPFAHSQPQQAPLHPHHNPVVVAYPANYELPRGLDASVIDTFPKFPYSRSTSDSMKSNMKIKTEECGVCLGGYQEKENLRMLPTCEHVFHADCVDPWLRSHATCPLCRASLLPNHLPGEMANRAEFRVNVDHGRG